MIKVIRKATGLLSEYPGQWAICGGVAASIYRNTPRFTDHIDIALIDSDKIKAAELATKIICNMGYKEYKGFVPDIKNNNQQVFGLIAGRDDKDERFVGLDFLLPVQFWVEKAVSLAQSNMIDYGFSKLPTITPESLVIAKIAAFSGTPERYQDLDDIKEIYNSISLDKSYILKELQDNQIKPPQEVIEIMNVK